MIHNWNPPALMEILPYQSRADDTQLSQIDLKYPKGAKALLSELWCGCNLKKERAAT